MRGASERVKMGGKGGGRAEIKREAEQRQQPGAHAKKPRRWCFAARCCVVWPCVAQQRDPSWRTIFHCHAANSEQKRTGKLRHSATLSCSVGRTRGEKKKHKRQRWRDSMCIISKFGIREEGGVPPGLWQFCQITSADHKPMFKTWWPRQHEERYGKMGRKEAGASIVHSDGCSHNLA